jgi:hypothetical protein
MKMAKDPDLMLHQQSINKNYGASCSLSSVRKTVVEMYLTQSQHGEVTK